MSIMDIVSLSLVGFIMYPFLRLVEGRSAFNIRYVVGLVCVIGFIKLAHSLPAVGLFARPKGACNCSIANAGGSYEGRSGMPSGHVMTTAYVVCMLALHFPSWYTYGLSVIAVVGMAASRLVKGCHTIPQVVAGAFLGFLAAYVATNL